MWSVGLPCFQGLLFWPHLFVIAPGRSGEENQRTKNNGEEGERMVGKGEGGGGRGPYLELVLHFQIEVQLLPQRGDGLPFLHYALLQ